MCSDVTSFCVLQKLSEMETRSFQESSPLLGSRKDYVLAVVRPILRMMREILAKLIEARDGEVAKTSHLLVIFTMF